MSRKILFRWLLTIALLLVVTLIWGAVSTSRVLADCGTPPKSSCISCHAPDGHVTAMGEWNSFHLNQDMCTNCHGGNGSAMVKDLAHEGMVAQPLSDIYTDCHSCHPSDYIARSEKLAAVLNVTPDSCATPTAVAIYGGSSGSHTNGIAISSDHAAGNHFWKSFMVITGMLASLAFFLLGLNWLNKCRSKS
jgi:hypothetical protein